MINMTFERFSAVAEAYGADPTRWPEAERHAMLDFMAAHPDRAAPVLEAARVMDQWLDVLTPAPVLAARLPDQRLADQRVTKSRRRLPLAWTGMGIAACIAGAAIGVNLSLHSLHDMRAVHMLDQVQLSEVDY